MENFVLRVAAEFSSRKEQLVFLINNYDMMLGVLMVQTLLLPSSPPGEFGFPHCSVSSLRTDMMLVLFHVLFLASGTVPGQVQ